MNPEPTPRPRPKHIPRPRPSPIPNPDQARKKKMAAIEVAAEESFLKDYQVTNLTLTLPLPLPPPLPYPSPCLKEVRELVGWLAVASLGPRRLHTVLATRLPHPYPYAALQAGGEKLRSLATYEDWEGNFYNHDGDKVKAPP